MSPTTKREPSFAATALRISAGVIVWAVHFAVIYGFTGLACARRFEPSGALWTALVPWVVGGATLAGAAAALAIILGEARSRARADFTAWMSACIAALALAAILLEAIPVLWLPVCP